MSDSVSLSLRFLAGRVLGRTVRPRPRFPGLEAGYLHEVHGQGDDRAAALAFALGAAAGEGALFLIRQRRGSRAMAWPCGDGLAGLGLVPSRLTLVEAEDERQVLRAALEAARCPDVAGVVLESSGRFVAYDLTASRRFALAMERGQGRVIVLRLDAEPRPSSAQTRWAVSSAPSFPLAARAPGRPALQAELLRCRGGPAGQRWRLEWDMEHGAFREATGDPVIRAPLPGAVVSLAALRACTAAARGLRAA